MDISELEWPRREDFERELLPMVKPTPKNDSEREELLNGLEILYHSCAAQAKNLPGLMQQAFPDFQDKAKKIRKAAKLLEETGLDFQETILELRNGAENIEQFWGRWNLPRRETERRDVVLNRCRDFLLSHGKHAGIGDTTNIKGESVQGMAVLLAQAVLKLATRNPTTGKGIYVSAQALSKFTKRARDKMPKKSE